MKSPCVLYVATVVKTHIMQFHVPYLKMLKDEGWSTAVAARNDYDDPKDCKIPYCDRYFDIPISRNPFEFTNIRAYKQLKKIINQGDYDIIHCHTPMGATLARLAARKARKRGTKVIYTAHGFHFYKGAPFINWLIYYPVERILAHLTDVLVTINNEDYERAKKFKAGKIEYIPGVGIDTGKFRPDYVDKSDKRAELGLSDDSFVLLSVGELTKNKNHRLVLDALGVLKSIGKLDNIHYIVCGSGALYTSLELYAEALGIQEHVLFLGYRYDVNEIYNASDVFVFMSYREGLPLSMIEAMASGLPIICSKIRGNIDLVEDDLSAIVIENDASALAKAITLMKVSQSRRKRFDQVATQIAKKYSIDVIKQSMMTIYKGCLYSDK